MDELIGEDAKQHRKVRRLVRYAVLLLTVLTLVSVTGAVYATWQSDLARARQLVATSAVSQSADAELSVLLAAEAVSTTWRWGHTVLPEAENQLHRSILASRVKITLSADVWSVSWSPDGNRIATGNDDKTATIWDVRTSRVLFTLRGHIGTVWSVAWSPDGKRLATGSEDRTAKIWDAETGKELITLRGSGDAHVAWSPDGMRLATESAESTIRTTTVWKRDERPETADSG